MIDRGRYGRIVALGVLAILAGCASPTPTLYTIAPTAGPTHTAAARVILMQQVSIARYLERSQIVVSSENYRLATLANDWWGEPLAAMLGRVLAQELGQRLPRSVVINENGAVSAAADATIQLDVQRLDEDASGAVVLQAQASVAFKGRGAPALRDFRFTAPPPAAGPAGEVGAISAALGQLADALAAMIAAGP